MIERIYVHNFRCLENFSIELGARQSTLVIGKNGSGKSTLRHAIEIFQKICRGSSRVADLIVESDFTQNRRHIPMRFQIELKLDNTAFVYKISFEMPEKFREARIAEESLMVNGDAVFSRDRAQVSLPGGSSFGLDWHVVALPIIHERPDLPIDKIKAYLTSMVLIAPIPANMLGYSEGESTQIKNDAGDFAAWLNSLLSHHPASYSVLFKHLKAVIPDLESFENVPRGEKGKQLSFKFERKDSPQSLSVDFNQLSDGEKCYFLGALLSASNKYNPVFCMWDEPDNHLTLPEVGHFTTQLRKIGNNKGQLIVTSHHPNMIRKFSDESTLVFIRESHLEPTVARMLSELSYEGDLIEALLYGEIIG